MIVEKTVEKYFTFAIVYVYRFTREREGERI